MARTADTHDYDPRFNRAQTVAGAKARYVDPELDYTLDDMERDIGRLLSGGEWPDADATYQGEPVPPTTNNPDRNRPQLEGQSVYL